ncbi:MAG TPA: hypothetical protein VGD42_06290, partial [Lysobacter sp.]
RVRDSLRPALAARAFGRCASQWLASTHRPHSMAQRSPPHILCGALRGQGRVGLFDGNGNGNDNDTSKWIPAFAGMT